MPDPSKPDKDERQERHSADPKSSVKGTAPKKGGGGGKYSVGKPGDEGYDDLDMRDPNYDSEGEGDATLTPEDTIFDKIVRGEIPCKKVYEDDLVLAFNDINAQAPVHILLIPKDRAGLSQLRFAGPKHEALLGHMMLTVGKIVQQEGLADYRIVVNDGEGAGQTVFHLHLHILAGRSMIWPPG